jgi:hypothetical protein
LDIDYWTLKTAGFVQCPTRGEGCNELTSFARVGRFLGFTFAREKVFFAKSSPALDIGHWILIIGY